jgi:hypothetical protein
MVNGRIAGTAATGGLAIATVMCLSFNLVE